MRNRILISLLCLGVLIALPLTSGAKWEQTRGPGGFGVNAFAVKGTKIFAGTQGGIFTSTDHGASWTASNAGLPAGYWVNCLGVSGPNLLAGSQFGLYLSPDEGLNWIRVTAGLPADVNIQCFVENGSDVVVGTEHQGVLVSHDNGANWIAAGMGLPPTRWPVQCLATSGPTLYAAILLAGIFLSEDHGKSWTEASKEWPKKYLVHGLAMSGGQLVAATMDGIYFSSDKGRNWKAASCRIPKDDYVERLEVIGPDVFAGTSLGRMFISRDNGRSWVASGSGLPANCTVNGLAACGTTVLAGMGENLIYMGEITWPRGVYKSTNGGATWKASNSGLANARVPRLAAIGPYLFAGLSLSTDAGASWVPVGSLFPELKWIGNHAAAGPFIFAVTNKGIVRFRNNGTRWERLSRDLPVEKDVEHLAACGSTLFASTDDRVFSTDDYGASWREVKIVLPEYRSWPVTIRDLAVTGEELCALVEVEEEIGQLFLSTKDGGRWNDFKGLRGTIEARCLGVNGQRLLAGGTGGIYVVNNEEVKTKWAPSKSPFEKSILCFALCGTTVIAASGEGVLFSIDGGDTWADLPAGPTYSNIESLEPGGPYLFAGTSFSGVWRLPLTQVPAGKK